MDNTKNMKWNIITEQMYYIKIINLSHVGKDTYVATLGTCNVSDYQKFAVQVPQSTIDKKVIEAEEIFKRIYPNWYIDFVKEKVQK